MADVLRFLLLPILIAAGWQASAHRREASRRAVRFAAVIALAGWAVIVATGLAQSAGFTLSSSHRWIGHALFTFTWLLVPLMIGVRVQQNGRMLLMLLLGAATLGIIFLNGVTGYLGPSHGDVRSEETVTRFYVLHCAVLPAIAAILLGLWPYILRPRRSYETPSGVGSDARRE
jgi:hypothetical protein